MPFYKHTILTKTGADKIYDGSRNKAEFDDSAFANQRMVNAMRHLSQLIKIADNIFGAIELECRTIFEKTKRLNIKIQHCQEVVDNLNAKAVKVPVGSLSSNPVSSQQFKSCDAEKIDKEIFLSFPRPTAVQHLRALAHGPSPPVVIPCGMVAPEVEDFTGTLQSSTSSTHIYCKPVKIKNVCKLSPTSAESGNTNAQYNNMTSDVKVPSSVVAIDVSGQPFSRMSTFRRSLIHVDFLIRRKRKKDKRRNTVAEGDVKELKDALQNIVNEECQISMSNGVTPYHRIITESKNDYNVKKHEAICDKLSEEKNNNAATMKISKNSSCSESKENQIILDGRSKIYESKINEQENISRQTSSKRKPKSHIPISTVSAAMNVAVKMRQCNGVKTEIPVSNGVISNIRSSADLESKLQEDRRMSDSSLFTDDDASQESWKDYKKRLQEKCRAISSKRASNEIAIDKEIEASSSTSSENISQHDKVNVGTSTESDSFIISSDESDEDVSEITYFQTNYGSSTSLGTGSGGSLNSLLSETGTEMTSSTGTLTSIGCDHLIPPPPPPPMILSATIKDNAIVTKVPESPYSGFDLKISHDQKYTKAENLPKKPQKSVKLLKTVKPPKGDNFESQKTVTEAPKNIFSSLVRMKTKEKNKNKKVDSKKVENKKVQSKKVEGKTVEGKKGETKTLKSTDKPAFDMYGHTSPKKLKQVPTFIKENISPVIPSEKQNNMKSFFANERSRNSIHLTEHDISEKLNPSCFRNSTFIPHSTPIADKENKGDRNQPVKIVPQKYEHQVTVTPVQRCSDIANKNVSHYKESLFKENQVNEQNLRYENKVRPVIVNAETQLHTTKYQRPQPPNTLQHERSKLAARVVLDFDGKVIYSTNSLDRKHYNSDLSTGMYDSVQNKLSESHIRNSQMFKQDKIYNSYQENQMQNLEKVSLSEYFANAASYRDDAKVSTPCVHFDHDKQSRSECEKYSRNEPWQSDHIKEHRAVSDSHYSPNLKLENIQKFVPKRLNQWPNSPDVYLHNPCTNLLPDPNVSGLPIQETMLTKHNVNLHSKQMENINMSSPGDSFNTTSFSCHSSPSSELNCGNILNKSAQSTMSTEDLFAVIHDCKKRMNIKTDSNISLPSSSSRSSSPSYLRPSSRGTLAETGFLSPRNQIHLETCGDRRSWADFRPVDSICSERKSLASDRLGPTKPTSMHDFKMLLLQARSSSQISGPRKSAVEMLKVPLNQNSHNQIQPVPLNLSPRNSISFTTHNSPTTELSIHNGHSTVPFKRGNRVRTSLQSRYIMYPPIFEDCSEDSENCNDASGNKHTDTVENGKDENVEWNHKNNHKLKIPGYFRNSENHFQPE